MPRAKPKTGWKANNPQHNDLTEQQRKRLRKCDLPEHVLPALETIAREALANAAGKLPTQAEVRAALKKLRKGISAARAAIAVCDEWTAKHIDMAHYRLIKTSGRTARVPTPRLDIVRPADQMLADFELAIEKANELTRQQMTPRPTALEMFITRQVALTFSIFGIPFDRTKRSPATDTLRGIISMVEPKAGHTAVEHYIREVEASGE